MGRGPSIRDQQPAADGAVVVLVRHRRRLAAHHAGARDRGPLLGPGKTAPNFGGAIGVTQDNVEGVDIYVPVYNFSETHHIDPAKRDGGLQVDAVLPDRVRQ